MTMLTIQNQQVS